MAPESISLFFSVKLIPDLWAFCHQEVTQGPYGSIIFNTRFSVTTFACSKCQRETKSQRVSLPSSRILCDQIMNLNFTNLNFKITEG